MRRTVQCILKRAVTSPTSQKDGVSGEAINQKPGIQRPYSVVPQIPETSE